MALALRWFIRTWLTLLLLANLAIAYFFDNDPISGGGAGSLYPGIELVLHPLWALWHLGFIVFNVVMALPLVLASAWRAKIIARETPVRDV